MLEWERGTEYMSATVFQAGATPKPVGLDSRKGRQARKGKGGSGFGTTKRTKDMKEWRNGIRSTFKEGDWLGH
jgi:hypothetical protein